MDWGKHCPEPVSVGLPETVNSGPDSDIQGTEGPFAANVVGWA